MIAPVSNDDLFAAFAFFPVLLATGLFDLRQMRIPNWLSWAGLALFAVCLPVLGLDEWLARSAIGGAAFMICFGLFAIGWLGGGDAKILPVTMLFVPLSHLPLYLCAFSGCMLLGMIGVWLARQQFAHPDTTWVSMKPGAAFPMGISIAASLPATVALAAVL
jgi:prepilin peptidase CpaA